MATAVILVSRERLHRFVRRSITDVEVIDALKFFVVALIILPLMPHARLGPYGAIDPRRIWTLVVAVTGLSWLGYLAVRILGPGRGMPLAGLAGGFVSGAATTGAMARLARTPGLRRPALAGALMASVATLIQLVVITAIADVRVAQLLAPAAVAGSLVLAIEAGLLSLRLHRRRATPASDGDSSPPEAAGAAPLPDGDADRPQAAGASPLGRPFALVPALVLATVLSVMLVAARFAEERMGDVGTLATISAAGLADAHAAALTAATLAAAQVLTVSAAALAALSAVSVNTVVKLVLSRAGGGWRIAVVYALLMIVPVAAAAAAMFATLTYV